MTGSALPERLRDAGLSAWELGDLLGIHPHLVSDPHPPLTDRPVQVLIEIARRLDIHPADLVPEPEPLLSHRRQAPDDADAGQDRRADALTVLTALATARAPLSAGQLARALGWPLPGTTAAIAAAHDNAGLGGPLALRRVPPQTWTVTPRLDILTQAQRRALRDLAGAAVLDDQAAVLLAALAAGQEWQSDAYAGLRAQPGWAAAEAALKQTGLIYSVTGRAKSTSATTSSSASATATTTTWPASSASPRRWTRPQHTQPEMAGPGRRPGNEHQRPGPAARSPARAGFRATEPQAPGPGPGFTGGPARGPGPGRASPGLPPLDASLPWRRGTAAVMSAPWWQQAVSAP
jgi:hypothetical protein